MKKSRFKKQPTRDNLAATWKVIRDQERIIKLMTERIRLRDRAMGNVLMAYPKFQELWVN
jgi:hypothetical protein